MSVTVQKTDRRLYEPYLRAKWGLKNHWYPALFGVELPEGGVKGVEIAGVPILLRRIKGRLYALHDRCLHRGVKLSHKPTCLTDDTITCWFHGFSYNLSDGVLMSIVGSPDDELIGKHRLRTFPVQEFRGMIFVFFGDEDYQPIPPLSDDLPVRPPKNEAHSAAHPLDEDAVILGIHTTVRCNWRLATENGFDPGHALVHRDNALVHALAGQRPQQLAYRPVSDDAFKVFEGDGPKGIMNMYGSDKYIPVTENKALNLRSATGTDFKFVGSRTSMYLPGVLMVENFPDPKVTHMEWYVPIDDKNHEYWRCIVANCPDESARERFTYRYQNFYEPLDLRDFNNSDVDASEAMQEVYERDGWNHETLFTLDAVLIGWRKLVSRYNRGIQTPPRGSE